MTRIVLTGGPSAGKTTLLELLHKQYGGLVSVAPEAASILFRGGFPRPVTFEDKIHTQRSIYALQREIELAALDKNPGTPLFCDRGSLDGAAYWNGSLKEFAFAMSTAVEKEMARYSAIIHLQTAPAGYGYTNTDVRTETWAEAAELDRKIGEIWREHPNYIFVGNDQKSFAGNGNTFIDKLNRALMAIRPFLPEPVTLNPKQRYATAADLL